MTAPDNEPKSTWKKFRDDWKLDLVFLVSIGALIASGVQACYMNKAMQIDQRAWMRAWPIPGDPSAPKGQQTAGIISDGLHVGLKIKVQNLGKTPAKNFHAKVVILPIAPGQLFDIAFDTKGHFSDNRVTGVFYPGQEDNLMFYSMDDNDRVKAFNENELEAIKSHEITFAVYGKLSYEDIFGHHRWSNFCSSIGEKDTYTQKSCGEFNAAN